MNIPNQSEDELFLKCCSAFQRKPSQELVESKCLPLVVSWRRASNRMFSFPPFSAELDGRALKGKWETPVIPASEDPKKEFSGIFSVWYGFDSDGEIVIRLDDYNSVYFLRTGVEVTAYTYSHRTLGCLEWYSSNLGVSIFVNGSLERTRCDYQFDSDGRVVGCEAVYPGGQKFISEFEYEGCELYRIHMSEGGKRWVQFERSTKSKGLKSLRKELLKDLADAVIKSLSHIPRKERAYSLVVMCQGTAYQSLLPPEVSVGYQSELEQFVKEHGDAAWYYLWQPPEWKHDYLKVPITKDLEARCKMANADVSQNDRYDEADKFLRDLAKEIGKRDLPCQVTEDFVSLMIKVDEDMEGQLESQLDKKSLKNLKSKKLLP